MQTNSASHLKFDVFLYSALFCLALHYFAYSYFLDFGSFSFPYLLIIILSISLSFFFLSLMKAYVLPNICIGIRMFLFDYNIMVEFG